jgi:hypothetical protein
VGLLSANDPVRKRVETVAETSCVCAIHILMVLVQVAQPVTDGQEMSLFQRMCMACDATGHAMAPLLRPGHHPLIPPLDALMQISGSEIADICPPQFPSFHISSNLKLENMMVRMDPHHGLIPLAL